MSVGSTKNGRRCASDDRLAIAKLGTGFEARPPTFLFGIVFIAGARIRNAFRINEK